MVVPQRLLVRESPWHPAQASRKSFMPARRLSLVGGIGFCNRGASRATEAVTPLRANTVSHAGGLAVASTGNQPMKAIASAASGNQPNENPKRKPEHAPPPDESDELTAKRKSAIPSCGVIDSGRRSFACERN